MRDLRADVGHSLRSRVEQFAAIRATRVRYRRVPLVMSVLALAGMMAA